MNLLSHALSHRSTLSNHSHHTTTLFFAAMIMMILLLSSIPHTILQPSHRPPAKVSDISLSSALAAPLTLCTFSSCIWDLSCTLYSSLHSSPHIQHQHDLSQGKLILILLILGHTLTNPQPLDIMIVALTLTTAVPFLAILCSQPLVTISAILSLSSPLVLSALFPQAIPSSNRVE